MSSPLVHLDAASVSAAIDQGVAGYVDAGNSGAAKTLDLRLAANQKLTLTASAPTVTLANGGTGTARRVRLLLTQDATGTRLLPTFVPAANYGAAGAPTLTVTAAKIDMLDFVLVNGSLYFLGAVKGF